MRQYYVLTQNPHCAQVFEFIDRHKLQYSLHLNRTRFWVPEGAVLTEFLLRFGEVCPLVDESLDLATGLPRGH